MAQKLMINSDQSEPKVVTRFARGKILVILIVKSTILGVSEVNVDFTFLTKKNDLREQGFKTTFASSL